MQKLKEINVFWLTTMLGTYNQYMLQF